MFFCVLFSVLFSVLFCVLFCVGDHQRLTIYHLRLGIVCIHNKTRGKRYAPLDVEHRSNSAAVIVLCQGLIIPLAW